MEEVERESYLGKQPIVEVVAMDKMEQLTKGEVELEETIQVVLA
jgi:hypothetical protein